jgi:hypothetical protein
MHWLRNVPDVERGTCAAHDSMTDSASNRIIDTSEEVKRMTEAEDEVGSSRWKYQLATSAIRPQRRFLAGPERLHEGAQCWVGRTMNQHANDDCLLNSRLSTFEVSLRLAIDSRTV